MPKTLGYQKLKDYRLGEEKRQSCGLMAKIIEYPSASDMKVQFEDGKIINHVSYYSFSQGTLNYNKQDMPEMAKNYRVGEKIVCSNEMVSTITAYRNSQDIDVQFDDGLKVEHISYARFFQAGVPHPEHKPVGMPRKLEKHIGFRKRTLSGYRELLAVHDDGTVDYLDDDGSIVCNAHTWEFFRKNTSFSKDRIRKKDRRKGFYEVAVNGVTLHYAVIGEGKPIVLIHGNGEDHNIFRVEIDQLVAAGYRVYAPDSRGHGANEPMPEYHYADMAEDVYEFIQAMGLTKPALYGHSDGGIIGLLLEIRHPGTLGVLAISGTNLSPEGLIPSFIKEYTEINNECPDPLITLMLTEPQINPEALKSIQIPVLVTAGENDLILRSETEKIASTIPNSTMIIVENEDHGSYIVNSEIMGNLLIDFLGKAG